MSIEPQEVLGLHVHRYAPELNTLVMIPKKVTFADKSSNTRLLDGTRSNRLR